MWVVRVGELHLEKLLGGGLYGQNTLYETIKELKCFKITGMRLAYL